MSSLDAKPIAESSGVELTADTSAVPHYSSESFSKNQNTDALDAYY